MVSSRTRPQAPGPLGTPTGVWGASLAYMEKLPHNNGSPHQMTFRRQQQVNTGEKVLVRLEQYFTDGRPYLSDFTAESKIADTHTAVCPVIEYFSASKTVYQLRFG
ncbi:hypothetical protein, unlikely [Trypanosoma brucei gambiense DAL972]|uniref:Uncharacterized protein n=1 Tax=Trypanosoma brucei gambiense (strain MHOM/CI/86/DAL972) TaxID=679716 RepID=C9ZU40_TRYB9|nr:hypothetical protein, unlikely [Trypanosoma brucei gambiense DAL972]XP_011775206.1 hypothetical protein, unlikely [Trypanosoma brucei gambiense DAL972]CBH12926.1 hypothetical protein, unlikely [Trypanosoma brucei gambiense DAL972]CBH12927.1 hypothetical protein, unlikely [Trypanosoma brucei gambiense DAL972]|eukprot:XP_011775205.1 hypothetical protein, unlikely [Trypanosoma brucei gambiense DAL972]